MYGARNKTKLKKLSLSGGCHNICSGVDGVTNFKEVVVVGGGASAWIRYTCTDILQHTLIFT